jgi:hypothetical protein
MTVQLPLFWRPRVLTNTTNQLKIKQTRQTQCQSLQTNFSMVPDDLSWRYNPTATMVLEIFATKKIFQ